MKTFTQFITEGADNDDAPLEEGDNFVANVRGDDVFKNPRPNDVMKHSVFGYGGRKESKVILHDKDAYTWSGMNAIHRNVVSHLGHDRENCHGLYLHHDTKRITTSGDVLNDNTKDAVLSHPWLRKHYPTYKFKGFTTWSQGSARSMHLRPPHAKK